MKRPLRLALLVLMAGAGYVAVTSPQDLPFDVPWGTPAPTTATPPTPAVTPLGEVTDAALRALVARQPVSLQALRARDYPGSALTVVRNLDSGVNSSRQVVSYESDGLTIYALLTMPC